MGPIFGINGGIVMYLGQYLVRVHMLIIDMGKEHVAQWEDECLLSFQENAVSMWQKEVNQREAKTGVGLNKLRTYASFKTSWGLEKYILCIDHRDKRVLLSKFRIGVCPLRIETGRYESAQSTNGLKKGIHADLRYCLCCNVNNVEDEFHFLMVCPVYMHLRSSLIAEANNELLKSTASIEEKQLIQSDLRLMFKYIMQSESTSIIKLLSTFLHEAFKLREQMVAT